MTSSRSRTDSVAEDESRMLFHFASSDGDKIVRHDYNPAPIYAFDRVFGQSTSSQEVYDVAIRPVVKVAIEEKMA